MRVGDRVLLKNPNQSPATVHGREGDPAGSVTVRDLVVTETHTMVNVLWQDGTRDLLDCKETIPYVNPDEYDCWYVPTINLLKRCAHLLFKAW